MTVDGGARRQGASGRVALWVEERDGRTAWTNFGSTRIKLISESSKFSRLSASYTLCTVASPSVDSISGPSSHYVSQVPCESLVIPVEYRRRLGRNSSD